MRPRWSFGSTAPALRGGARMIAMASGLCALGACSFEGKMDTSPSEMNMCSVASDCPDGSDCIDGMCQAQAADEKLTIALQVTPMHMPNGADPLPILLDAFSVNQPIERSFSLKSAVVVSGNVRAGGTPIEADVSFTPVTKIPGIAPTTVTASLAASATASDHDFSVRLLKDVDYRMIVRPTDMGFAPFAKTFTAGAKVDLNVDFVTLDTMKRTFAITGAPTDRDLLVTAFDALTGAAVSSTAKVAGGKVVLLFAADASEDFRLEIRASQTYNDATMAADQLACDTDTPAFPVFSINSADLTSTDSSGRRKIALPPQPERIRYEGTVELCPDEPNAAANVSDLPITLHAQSLLFSEDTKLAASFDTTTSANYDKASNSLHFCVEIMAGEYDVLATPPAGMRCALFAERREIKPPAKMTMSKGMVLTLPEAAYLSGTLQTMGPSPLSGASVDAIALGQSNVIDLPAGDQSITRYNRSSQTTTSDSGSFKLPVDLGAYDVVIKPPVDSGFPWQLNHDVKIGLGARMVPLSSVINMPSPVVVTGALQYPGASADTATLDGAEIDAYAIIHDENDGMDGTRAIAIGKAIADDKGKFMLLLPPSTQGSW